ncbi:VOC family protein [soil metagenome]
MKQRITPYLLYADAAAALDWIAAAFGFTETLRHADDDGGVNHAEMELGGGSIMLGEPGPDYRNPKVMGGVTQLVHVYVEDADAHCARARAAGATIEREPADPEYGERNYGAVDPEGHRWFFAQKLREVSPEQWGATGAGDG